MISDVLCEAIEAIKEYDASPMYADPPTRAMIDALKGHMQAVLAYLDAPPQIASQPSDERIKRMAERFLGWRLPEGFHPDAGISFEPVFNKGSQYEGRHQPTGTNLFDYTQAVEMVRHMAEGLTRES